MNFMRCSRSLLSQACRLLVRHYKPAVRLRPPQLPITQYHYHRAQRRPEFIGSIGGLFFRHATPTVCHPPGLALPRAYFTSPARSVRGLFSHMKPAVRRPPPAPAALPRHYGTSPRTPMIHFPRRYSRWHHDPRKVAAAALIPGSAAMAAFYGYHLEKVPYTSRTHFILLSPKYERELGEEAFDYLKEEEFADKILDPLHPDSVRVRLITERIVGAVHRSLSIKSRDAEADESTVTRSAEELLNDMPVTESRKKGKKMRGPQPQTRHLEGLNWEVIVIKDKDVNAMCLPGGKIMVYTGLLDHFKTDAEIATILAHEVGHAIARHSAEKLTNDMWFPFLKSFILQFIDMPGLVDAMAELFLDLPLSRRMEIEADHIGIMLLGAAGFDPQVAPAVFEKLEGIGGYSPLEDYLSTHPSGRTRSQLLSQAQVMEEALELYRDIKSKRARAVACNSRSHVFSLSNVKKQLMVSLSVASLLDKLTLRFLINQEPAHV